MKKRILLLTSAEPEHGPLSTAEKRFPLGLGFLIAVLREAGHEVFFVDNYLERSDEIASGYLQKNRIDFVGIYSNTLCFRDTVRIITEALHQRADHDWHGHILVGGPHASLFPHSFPEGTDFVVAGEGERTIVDIVNGAVPEGIVQGEKTEELDTLPMPAYDCFQDDRYWVRVPPCPDHPIYTMNTSRGCPFGCRFCSVKGVWGRTYRAFSARRVVEDIAALQEQYGIKGVYFREDHFTFDKERVREFSTLLMERKMDIQWFCESRISDIDAGMLRLMKRSGCQWIYYGCESGSPRVLKHMRKGITVEQIRDVMSLCRQEGIATYTSWVAGVPTETEAELQMTVDLIAEIKPTQACINVFIGLPGSEMYEELMASDEFYGMDDIGVAYSTKYNDLVKRFYGANADRFYFTPEPQLVSTEARS